MSGESITGKQIEAVVLTRGLFTIGLRQVSDVGQSYVFRATSEVIHDACRTNDGRVPVVKLVVNLPPVASFRGPGVCGPPKDCEV